MKDPYVIEPSMDLKAIVTELERLAEQDGFTHDGDGRRILESAVRIMFHIGAALYIVGLLADIEDAGFSTENFEIFFD